MVSGKHECLLSHNTATALDIIRFQGDNSDYKINEIEEEQSERVEDYTNDDKVDAIRELQIDEFEKKLPALFNGKLGGLKGVKIKLDVDPTIKPVRQPQRPVPIHLREPVTRELLKQVEEGILERVTQSSGPTPWISNLVLVMKYRPVCNPK